MLVYQRVFELYSSKVPENSHNIMLNQHPNRRRADEKKMWDNLWQNRQECAQGALKQLMEDVSSRPSSLELKRNDRNLKEIWHPSDACDFYQIITASCFDVQFFVTLWLWLLHGHGLSMALIEIDDFPRFPSELNLNL